MTTKKYFENLDGLRFVLAMIVFASHSKLGETLTQLSSNNFINRLIITFSKGFLGVSSFFVLSGFLITYLMIEEKDHRLAFNLKNFYLRRSFRIWPLYYTVLAFTFLIYPLIKTRLGFNDLNPYSLVYHIFFFSNFDSIHVQHDGLVEVAPLMININWSISIEEQFYLIWPLLFFFFPPQRFWVGCLVVIIASWIFRMVTDDSAYLYYHTLSVISDLGIGAFFACLCYYNSDFTKGLKNVKKSFLIFIYLLGILWLMYSDILFSDYFMHTSSRVINALFFAFIILEQSYAKNSFYKFSNAPRLSAMGKFTFGLYMVHPIGIQASIIIFKFLNIQREQGFLYSLAYSILALIFSMFLAIGSYYLIERRFLVMRKKFA